MNKELDKIIKYAEEIAGSWNGDEKGKGEDRAMIAYEILEKCGEIKDLLNELNS